MGKQLTTEQTSATLNSLDWFIEQTCGLDSKVWAKEIAIAKQMYEIELCNQSIKTTDKILKILDGKGQD